MSIARAFTTRRVKQSFQSTETDATPNRSNTLKGAVGSIRHKISAPVELIYTTNTLSYNAPDIFPKTASSESSASSSHRSDDDTSEGTRTAASSPPTSPDVESLPKSRALPNHLSSYFMAPEQAAAPSPVDAPTIPHRAPSHTKKPYSGLVRQRSTSRMSEQSQHTVSTKASFTFSRSSSSSTGTSTTSHNSTPPTQRAKVPSTFIASPPLSLSASSPPQVSALQPQRQQSKDLSQSQHPFGPELAQVSEIAEEYGVKEKLNEAEVEEKELVSKGLLKFSANDYLGEIQGLFFSFFGEAKAVAPTIWI